MYPRLITEPFTLPTYGVLLAIAFLAALWLANRQARRAGLDPERISDTAVFVIIAGLLGAKLLLVVVEWSSYSAQFSAAVALRASEGWGPALKRLGRTLLGLVQSAGVFYGGLLGALPVAYWCIRRYRLPFWPTADVLAPAVILGQAIGRWGCYFAGCCWGRVAAADVRWRVHFADPYTHETIGTPDFTTPLKPGDERFPIYLHPTQLYESLACFTILALLLWLTPRKRFHGQVLSAYLALYAVARFVIEHYRGDPRGSVGALSTSQFIAVLMLAAAFVLFVRLRVSQRLPEAPAPRA